MSSKEVYRGVNKYIDYSSGDEFFEYSKTYSEIGQARAGATRLRHPSGKRNPVKKVGGTYVMQDRNAYPNDQYQIKKYNTFYEFSETWCERAKEWERV